MKYLSIFVLTCLLAACGAGHPKVLSFTPASIIIDYSDSDLHSATDRAQQYCSSLNKDAQYVRTEEKGWVSTTSHAFFNCVERLRDLHMNNQGGGSATPVINNFR